MNLFAVQRDFGEIVDNGPGDVDLQHLLSTQVDDLVKYQVVRLLYEHPDVIGDPSFFAAALGFHSAEYTRASLEELADCGVLHKELCQGSNKSLYCFSNDPVMRERITKLCSLEPKSPQYGQVLRLLAGRSLRRAQKRATHKSRDDLPSEGKRDVQQRASPHSHLLH